MNSFVILLTMLLRFQATGGNEAAVCISAQPVELRLACDVHTGMHVYNAWYGQPANSGRFSCAAPGYTEGDWMCQATELTEQVRAQCNGFRHCAVWHALSVQSQCEGALTYMYAQYECVSMLDPVGEPIHLLLPLLPGPTAAAHGIQVFLRSQNYPGGTPHFAPQLCLVLIDPGILLRLDILDLSHSQGQQGYCVYIGDTDVICAKHGGNFPMINVESHGGRILMWFWPQTPDNLNVQMRFWLLLSALRKDTMGYASPSQMSIECGLNSLRQRNPNLPETPPNISPHILTPAQIPTTTSPTPMFARGKGDVTTWESATVTTSSDRMVDVVKGNLGVIMGGVAAGLVLIIVVSSLLVYVCRRRQRAGKDDAGSWQGAFTLSGKLAKDTSAVQQGGNGLRGNTGPGTFIIEQAALYGYKENIYSAVDDLQVYDASVYVAPTDGVIHTVPVMPPDTSSRGYDMLQSPLQQVHPTYENESILTLVNSMQSELSPTHSSSSNIYSSIEECAQTGVYYNTGFENTTTSAQSIPTRHTDAGSSSQTAGRPTRNQHGQLMAELERNLYTRPTKPALVSSQTSDVEIVENDIYRRHNRF